MFLSRNKKNIDTFWLKKCLIKSYAPCFSSGNSGCFMFCSTKLADVIDLLASLREGWNSVPGAKIFRLDWVPTDGTYAFPVLVFRTRMIMIFLISFMFFNQLLRFLREIEIDNPTHWWSLVKYSILFSLFVTAEIHKFWVRNLANDLRRSILVWNYVKRSMLRIWNTDISYCADVIFFFCMRCQADTQKISFHEPASLAQWDTRPTGDHEVAGLNPAVSEHSFIEIDH